WLTCLPVTQEIAGSAPVGTAILYKEKNETNCFVFFICFNKKLIKTVKLSLGQLLRTFLYIQNLYNKEQRTL
ncbi:hypothetical protein CON42_29760, partial [Bacillus thuringiensis]